jgi:hypothetical protein
MILISQPADRPTTATDRTPGWSPAAATSWAARDASRNPKSTTFAVVESMG